MVVISDHIFLCHILPYYVPLPFITYYYSQPYSQPQPQQPLGDVKVETSRHFSMYVDGGFVGADKRNITLPAGFHMIEIKETFCTQNSCGEANVLFHANVNVMERQTVLIKV